MQEVAMQEVPMHETFAPLAQDISFLSSNEIAEHSYPFFADGFAGLIYSRSEQPFRLKPGDHVLMTAIGGGLSWGAIVAEWGNIRIAQPATNTDALLVAGG